MWKRYRRFFHSKSVYFSELLLINKECASHFLGETSNKNKKLEDTKT